MFESSDRSQCQRRTSQGNLIQLVSSSLITDLLLRPLGNSSSLLLCAVQIHPFRNITKSAAPMWKSSLLLASTQYCIYTLRVQSVGRNLQTETNTHAFPYTLHRCDRVRLLGRWVGLDSRNGQTKRFLARLVSSASWTLDTPGQRGKRNGVAYSINGNLVDPQHVRCPSTLTVQMGINSLPSFLPIVVIAG